MEAASGSLLLHLPPRHHRQTPRERPQGRYFANAATRWANSRKHKLAKRRLAAVPNISASSDLHLTLTNFTLDDLPVTGQSDAATIVAPVPLTTPFAPATFTTPFPAPTPVASPPPPAPTASALPASPRAAPLQRTAPPTKMRLQRLLVLPKLNNLLTVREEHTNQITRHNRRLKTLKPSHSPPSRLRSPPSPSSPSADGSPCTHPSINTPPISAQAVEEMLSDIQDGSNTAYDNALHLIATHTPARDDACKSAFKLMHDDFLQRYGQNWLPGANRQHPPRPRHPVHPLLHHHPQRRLSHHLSQALSPLPIPTTPQPPRPRSTSPRTASSTSPSRRSKNMLSSRTPPSPAAILSNSTTIRSPPTSNPKPTPSRPPTPPLPRNKSHQTLCFSAQSTLHFFLCEGRKLPHHNHITHPNAGNKRRRYARHWSVLLPL